MKFLKYICLLVIGFAFIIGCSGDYGKLRFQTDTEEKMTLAELRKNREDYHVYWCTRAYHIPVAIMFDPKNDETRIVGDSWIKISDQQTLSETIETKIGDRYFIFFNAEIHPRQHVALASVAVDQ